MIHVIKVGEMYVSDYDGEVFGASDKEFIASLDYIRLSPNISDAKVVARYDNAKSIANSCNGEVMLFDEVLN